MRIWKRQWKSNFKIKEYSSVAILIIRCYFYNYLVSWYDELIQNLTINNLTLRFNIKINII